MVTHAWRFLMGASFHYGYFSSKDRDLDRATSALTERMAVYGKIDSNHLVLDVGCGIGEPAMSLSRRSGCRVVGISTSEVGVREATARTAAAGLSNRLSFLVRDGMANALEDESFDCIWVLESSHLMHDKSAMIRDSARVLKSGGKLVLCDIIAQRQIPLKDVLKQAHEFDLLRRVFGRAKLETLDAYRKWLVEAGLEVDHCEDLSIETAPTFDCWQANADRHREEVVAMVGEEVWTDFRLSCDVLRNMWAEDLLGYGLIAATKPHESVPQVTART